MKISDVPGTQSAGYLVRFPFYILAERDAHIIFTETNHPNWATDNVYEFGKFLKNTLFDHIFLIHRTVCMQILLTFSFRIDCKKINSLNHSWRSVALAKTFQKHLYICHLAKMNS